MMQTQQSLDAHFQFMLLPSPLTPAERTCILLPPAGRYRFVLVRVPGADRNRLDDSVREGNRAGVQRAREECRTALGPI